MYCKHCGKEIADDSKFCRYCGTDLTETDSIVEINDNNDIELLTNEVSESIISDNTIIVDESNIANNEKESNNSFDIEAPHKSKIMDALGILSGILLFGLFGLLGLGALALGLFFLHYIIMMNMPNGLGITIFIIILAVVVYFVVKVIITILKGLRK